MSALRRALGDGQGGNRYVLTVPGRGYNFVAPVRREEALPAAPAPPVPSMTPHNLPFAVTRMIGRDDAVAALVARLSRERLLTIVGAGGIGKTTVALAVAERMMAGYEHGVWLVDMAPLGDPRLVSSAVATCSVWKSAPKIRLPPLSPPSGTIGCCCCSTIASTSSMRRPAWQWLFSAERRTSTFWRPAESRSGYRVNASTASHRSVSHKRRPD